MRERLLGPDDPGTLNSRGNLAAAYRDSGRAAEAIPLLERTLAGRERALGPDHPDTQTSRKNLARAYQDAGRAAEAIPLERTSAGRERVLRSDRPGTQTSRKNLASADRDAGRAAKAIRPAEQSPAIRKPAGQSPAIRKSQPPDSAAGQMLRAEFRQPPADPAKRVLPAGFRRPPVDPARQPLPDSIARPPAKLTDHSASWTQNPPEDIQHDREVVAAITAEDPAGIAKAYDRYAAALYGYCHWKLQDLAGAAGALQDTFVIAAVTLSNLSEPSSLRPRLFALARNECQRRIRSTSAGRDEEADAADQQADAMGLPTEAMGLPTEAMGLPTEAMGLPSDATIQFPVVGGPSDATIQFPAVSEPPDATIQFPAVSEPSDATIQFPVLGQPFDATIPFRVVSRPADARNGPAHINGDQGQAELRNLVDSILAGLKPREREVIELSFRYDLHDNDLAIALGVSLSRAQALASRAQRSAGGNPQCAAHRAYQAGGLPSARGAASRMEWAADRADARPGQLPYRGVPDLRPSRMGFVAPGGVFPPAAASPASPGTARADPESLYLHRCGCGGVSPAGSPARGMDMGREVLAGDQAGELEQRPGQSGSGGRHRGHRGVGRGRSERQPAHLRRCPRRTCPAGPGTRRDLLK